MLPTKLSAAVAAHRMFAPGDLVVVGVSGGPDSVALLHGLTGLSQTLPLRLHVAHLDHMLRGAASAQDAAYVAALARDLGWPASVEARDVAELRRRHKMSLEEAARLARYTFFGDVVRRTGAVGVALGHTADDQVETIVLHWLRGAGPGGLRGMRPVRLVRLFAEEGRFEALRVLRPLLDVTRAEVEAYCREHDLRPRSDPTNRDLRFLRNRVRWELLPDLKRYNPRFADAVRRAASIAAADDDFLAEQAAAAWPALVSEEPGRLRFHLARWRQLPRSLQYRVLREGAARLRGNLLGLSAVHLDAAVETMNAKPPGSTVVWPRGLRLVKRYEDFIMDGGLSPAPLPAEAGESLAIPGVTSVAAGRWRVRAQLIRGRCLLPAPDPWHADLDAAAVGAALLVRRRRPGDRFQPLGMKCEKKLQDFLVDAKVPREERDALPVVATDGKIIWLAGLRIAEWAKVGPETETTLCLRFEPLAN